MRNHVLCFGVASALTSALALLPLRGEADSQAGSQNAPSPCAGLDQDACDASTDCHSVYYDPQTCGCVVLGCCTFFDHCADGAQADCSGRNLACRRLAPHCEGPYVVSYVGMCYEGCVRADECNEQPPIVCLPGRPPTFPSFDKTCSTDADCDFGYHLTDCCGSARAIGFNVSQRASFDDDEAICDAQYPRCGCFSRIVFVEDGQRTTDRSTIAVSCAGNQCNTFIVP